MLSEQKRSKPLIVIQLLRAIEKEALEKGNYNIPREAFFRCALRASFVRAYQFAVYCNKIKWEDADEGSFMSSALRGTCEDLIALKFIRRLPRRLRDEIIAIEMSLAVHKAVVEQTKFFGKKRPFQQVISYTAHGSFVEKQKDRLADIARTTGLWNPGKQKKLPSMQQMAVKVGMREEYDYFYRVTSDVVHFNPRIALRNGWGPDPKRGKFSTANFACYYLRFCQVYSVVLFAMIARAFAKDLSLSSPFREGLAKLEKELERDMRWPEAVTYEEMNRQPPSMIVATLARVIWEDPALRRKWKRAMVRVAPKPADPPSATVPELSL